MRYRTIVTAFTFLLILNVGLSAQESGASRLQAYQSNFAGANLQTKLEILRSVDREDVSAMGPLYGQALSHAVSNAPQLLTEPMLREIALIAVEKIREAGYTRALNDLWRFFSLYEESSSRIRVAGVFGALARGDEQTVRFLNAWVRARNDVVRAGGGIDMQVMAAVVEALGSIGSASSFDALIETVLQRYPNFVGDAALASILKLEGNRLELAIAALNTFPPAQRLALLNYAVSSDALLDADQRLRFAHRALVNGLSFTSQNRDEVNTMRTLRHSAAMVLADGGYGDATREMIRHFNETVLEFDRGQITKDRVLESIAGLGAMNTPAAAARLTDYLELINTYTEIDRPYDVQVLLAVLENLRKLRRPESYNALFYTTMLEKYPSRVREAARGALGALAQ